MINKNFDNFDVVAVLSHYGLISNVSSYDEDIKIICPFHEEAVPSCNVSLTSGLYHCFGCGRDGDIIDLIAQIEKVNQIKAMIIATKIGKKTAPDRVNQPLSFYSEKFIIDKIILLSRAKLFFDELSAPSWDVIKNHYLFGRGFTSEILKEFDVKINQSSAYPIIIPLCEEEIFKGYILRRTDSDEPKYLFSRGFEKHNTVVGSLDKVPVLVVEGILDLMKARQYGYKNVCSILGWSASSYQLNKIGEVSNRIISALDNDETGNRGHNILKKNFGDRVVRFSYPKNRKDICELPRGEFNQSIKITLGDF